MPPPRALIAPDREREIVTLAEGLAIDAFGLGPVDPEQLGGVGNVAAGLGEGAPHQLNFRPLQIQRQVVRRSVGEGGRRRRLANGHCVG